MPERSGRSHGRPPSPVALVLFDLDDTLFDHTFSVLASLRAVRARYPALRRRRLADLRARYQQLLEAVHPAVVRGEVTLEESRRARMLGLFQFCGTVPDDDELDEANRVRLDAYLASRRAVPGAGSLVRALHRDARVGIVSNNTVAEQRAKLRNTGLAETIDFLITSGETGFAKPDPRIFEEAFHRGRAGPSETVMVGDQWWTDVAGANAAGCSAIWFNRFGLTAPAGASVPQIGDLRPAREVAPTILRRGRRAPPARSPRPSDVSALRR